eukprot:1263272-Rhodomonas_salina.1
MPFKGRMQKETLALYCQSISMVRVVLCRTGSEEQSGSRTEQDEETGTRVAQRELATSSLRNSPWVPSSQRLLTTME